jgi:hypothetical protein
VQGVAVEGLGDHGRDKTSATGFNNLIVQHHMVRVLELVVRRVLELNLFQLASKVRRGAGEHEALEKVQ